MCVLMMNELWLRILTLCKNLLSGVNGRRWVQPRCSGRGQKSPNWVLTLIFFVLAETFLCSKVALSRLREVPLSMMICFNLACMNCINRSILYSRILNSEFFFHPQAFANHQIWKRSNPWQLQGNGAIQVMGVTLVRLWFFENSEKWFSSHYCSSF